MQINQNILTQYFLGQSSPEEKEVIHKWIESGIDNKEAFIRERIRFDASLLVEEEGLRKDKKFHFHTAFYKITTVAASIVILIGAFFLYENLRNREVPTAYQSIYVPPGNRTNIVLPDGTNVWLNANTHLEYPSVFSKESRQVKLNGEAYFEVKKDKIPFIVMTDKYDIRVLGTTFNVEAYADNSDFATSLYEGSVELFDDAGLENVKLKPGETAQVVDNTLEVKPTIDLNSYKWKDGLIFIENKSFEQIMKRFEKCYDVNIIINNQKVRTLGYKGKLRISDGVDHALRVLQKDFPFRYTRDEEKNNIYIN